MATPEVNGNIREGRWVEEILAPIANDLKIVNWARNVLAEYIDLPRANNQERKKVNNLVTPTASQLLRDPQRIEIALDVWDGQWFGGSSKDRPGSFYELVKTESAELIKKNWKDVTSEQLADLIGIYTNSPSAQDFAKDLLRNYFKGPDSRNQRIDAYYNFVSGVLDLAEEDEAFREGMKVALHATEILPKNPSLVEQTGLLSLPYREVESVFKKLLIARSVIAQVRFMGSWDLDKYYEDRGNFIITDSVAIEEGDKRKGNVIRKIGESETREMYNIMKAAMRFIASGSIESLSEGVKQSLKDTWPYNLAFDETDPLNQKFQEVFPQIVALKEARELASMK